MLATISVLVLDKFIWNVNEKAYLNAVQWLIVNEFWQLPSFKQIKMDKNNKHCSLPELLCEKVVLRNFAKFVGKHMY